MWEYIETVSNDNGDFVSIYHCFLDNRFYAYLLNENGEDSKTIAKETNLELLEKTLSNIGFYN